MRDLREGLVEWGVSDDRVHSEMFGPDKPITPGVVDQSQTPPHPPEGPVGSGSRVNGILSVSCGLPVNQANIKAYMLACLLACFSSQSRIASATMSCCDHGAVRSSFRETATLMSSFTQVRRQPIGLRDQYRWKTDARRLFEKRANHNWIPRKSVNSAAIVVAIPSANVTSRATMRWVD
jgi:hypothetical protein